MYRKLNDSQQPLCLCRRISCHQGKGGLLRCSRRSGPDSHFSVRCCVQPDSCGPCSALPDSTCPEKQTCSPCSHRLLIYLHGKANKKNCPHLCNLHTPVEQELGIQAVLLLPDVLQQRTLWTELGHQLQTGTWADAQQPNDVRVVQAAHGEHMLHNKQCNDNVITGHLLAYDKRQAFNLYINFCVWC